MKFTKKFKSIYLQMKTLIRKGMVTHDPDSARRAYRILRLKDGHLEGEKVHHDD